MKKQTLFTAIFILAIYVFLVVGLHQFTTAVPGANDFYPRWRGAQLFWREGIDPYSQTATDAIQMGIYGRLATPEEDQLLFVYPFYTVFLLIPWVWLEYSWVQASWLALLLTGLVTAVACLLKFLGWRQPTWLLALTLLWSVIFYNSARTILLGQFAGLIFLWLVLSLLALKQQRDGWAGIFLALTTIKPQMSFLFIPALLLWAVRQQRWRLVGGFVATMALLTAVSFALLPSWLVDFVRQVAFYPDYTFTGSPLWVLTDYYFPWLGKPVEYGLIGLLLVGLFWHWRLLWQRPLPFTRFVYIISLTVIVTNLIVVRTATTNYIIMYIPLFLILHTLAQKTAHGRWAIPLFYLLSTLFSWLLFLNSVQGDLEHPITYLPLPFLLLAVLLPFRRQWIMPNRPATAVQAE